MLSAIILFGTLAVLLVLAVPVSWCIGIAAFLALLVELAVDRALFLAAQQMATALDSFALVALPMFVLSGHIMNTGGIARRLIEFAKVVVGWLPGALAHITVVANMLFGAISGSAVAACAAVGGLMAPIQRKEGYDPRFCAAVNICSSPTGLLIPPSGAFIVYSVVAGGVSISDLFLAGYLPGIAMGLGIMVWVAYVAWRDRLPRHPVEGGAREALAKFVDALPALGLIVVVVGGIAFGVFTATEASAIAVVYSLALAALYREMKLSQLWPLFVETATGTAVVLLMVSASMVMSWVMVNAGMPKALSAWLLGLSDNPYVILALINVVLLVMGTFLDITPGLLIFTPIFLPVVTNLGMDPVHFGVMIVFNLCIGIATPPVGSTLFIGAAAAGVSLQSVNRPMLPMFAAMIVVLYLITYVPWFSLAIPRDLVPWLAAIFGTSPA